MSLSFSRSGKKFIQILGIILVIVNGNHYLLGFLHPAEVLTETMFFHYIWLPIRIKVPTVFRVSVAKY